MTHFVNVLDNFYSLRKEPYVTIMYNRIVFDVRTEKCQCPTSHEKIVIFFINTISSKKVRNGCNYSTA